MNAGDDMLATEGSTVSLDGTVTDADAEDELDYTWSHNSTELTITFVDNKAVDTTFDAPNVSENTDIEFTLTVSDGTVTVSDTMVVTIADSPPDVNAGDDMLATEGSTVSLDGTVTDADAEDELDYTWSHNSTELTITFVDNKAVDTTFDAPNVSENTDIEFTLTVSDGTVTVSDTMVVTIADSPPDVNAGDDMLATEGSTVSLDGTVTDADAEDELDYTWSHNSTELTITFVDNKAVDTTFDAPNVSENTDIEFTLTVSDGTVTVSDTMVVTIADSPPDVNAGDDMLATEGSTVSLDGTVTDADAEDELDYTWSHNSTELTITFVDNKAVDTTFDAPNVSENTDIEFTLTVSDGTVTVSDSVIITITDSANAAQTADAGAFITTWRTGAAGESITIPVGGATGTYTVDWGDENTSVDVTGDQTHLYDDAGTHTVRISGDFTRIYLNGNTSNADKLVSIERWGDTRWESMISAFHGASNMVYRATDVPVLSDVTSMRYMFYDAQSFDGDLSGWDVSRVTDMVGTFWGASSFNGDLSGWDVSRVTDMVGTFWGASSFNGDLSGWDVLSVTDMTSMFNGASSFNGDLSGWDVLSVTDMTSMFAGASSFNGDLSGWNVSRVTGMFAMFSAADSFDADLSGWNVSSVTAMSVMFRGASSFDADLSGWDVSSVDAMSAMFMDASSFDADLSDWNVSGVTDMSNMFRDASSFNGDLSGWDVSRVTDMSDMFSGAHSFNADLSSWSVSRVTDMYAMFNDAHSFNADISGLERLARY